jgi:hypothetical protein
MATRELTAIPLMQMISGFWASKTLATAVELDLFTQLSGRGVDIRELSQLLELHPRPAEMLLTGCASLGLLEKRGERYHNSPLSEEFLVRGKPYYFGGVITLLDRRLYLPWNRLPEAIKTNRAQTWGDQPGIFEAMSANPEEQRIFTEGMHSFSVQSGEAVAAAFDFLPYAHLLDVGGGSGAYCIEAARRYPHLRATVFDLPAALEIAREKIAEAAFADRITRCFDALPSGGAVIVSELMMNDEKTGPASAALMSLNMLIETEGRNYTWAEYTEWLKEVGFREIQRVPVVSPGANGLLVGRKR